MKIWKITIKVKGNPDWTIDNVPADTEGKAKTEAIAHYPHPLAGKFVEYEVKQKDVKK